MFVLCLVSKVLLWFTFSSTLSHQNPHRLAKQGTWIRWCIKSLFYLYTYYYYSVSILSPPQRTVISPPALIHGAIKLHTLIRAITTSDATTVIAYRHIYPSSGQCWWKQPWIGPYPLKTSWRCPVWTVLIAGNKPFWQTALTYMETLSFS